MASNPGLRLLAISLTVIASATVFAETPHQSTDARPFRIIVVDEETERGVPLVELRTVNQILYVTDSNGVVAFDEPGLMGRRVFFEIRSHGYEYSKDGFGYAGAVLEPKLGGEARLKIKRTNIAERLYRITGGGIYRDSLLTDVPAPIREPVINGLVLGQDSVLTAEYRGKLYWFWGDTSWPGYPLGNFHTPGAVSDLPSNGGLDPSAGIDLTYFLDENGFAKPACKMPGEGPTWITGLVVLADAEGRERMFANYAKIKPPMTTYERGAVEWDPDKNEFVQRIVYTGMHETTTGSTLSGHTFLHRDGDVDYVYYCNPFPLTRVPADPDRIIDEDAVEVFTCLKPGTRVEEGELDRDADGRLRYTWKTQTQRVDQNGQEQLQTDGKLKANESLIQLRDVVTGKPVKAHGGSVYWNEFRKRWVMLFVELGGTSMLGEMWFAEADAPTGPWSYAIKIASHNDYSFYNPKQHPTFDQDDGRFIYFEGTYTASFSGAKEQTPRYDYNQVMYRLDLSGPRLNLPVAVYEVDPGLASGGLATSRTLPDPSARKRLAFFAHERPGSTDLPVVETSNEAEGARLTVAAAGDSVLTPKFAILPRESELAETTLIYEYSREGGLQRTLSIDPDRTEAGWRRSEEPVGRVWMNSGPTQTW